MAERTIIKNGNIVTPDRVIENGTIILENGKIVDILEAHEYAARADQETMFGNVVHARGKWVMPGMIDTHSDAIEHEMQPRPASRFPIELSFGELERKLVSQGVTTIHHSLSMWDDHAPNWARRSSNVKTLMNSIRRLAAERNVIHHKLHLRFEITNVDAIPVIEQMLQDREIDQISFMDHTPGQGQYRNSDLQRQYMIERQKLKADEVDQLLEERKAKPKTPYETLERLAKIARAGNIPLASHDDDSAEKVQLLKSWDATISEFPVELSVAQEARRNGLYVVMGAPNVMLGRSHSNNLSAIEAISHGVVDILCSDYYPPAMMHAVFKLAGLGHDMSYAVNLVSHNPAKALGVDHYTGSLEIGKDADVLIVSEHSGQPVIEQVFVSGLQVFQIQYHVPMFACEVLT